MTQPVSSPPIENKEPQTAERAAVTEPKKQKSRIEIIALLVLIALLIVMSTSLFFVNLVQLVNPPSLTTASPVASATVTHTTIPGATVSSVVTPTPTPIPPLLSPGNAQVPPLQLSEGRYVLYEQQNNIYMVSSTGGTPQLVNTTNYVYNPTVRPILTPAGKLLYSGDGIWLTDVFGGTPVQIADLPQDQVVTSLVLSSDGTTVAWSTAPANGSGSIDLYAGPLMTPTKVYEKPSNSCPCFRIFSFAGGTGKQGDTTLLLSDSQQSTEPIQYGLWSFDLTNPSASPQPVLDESSSQGPLLLSPDGGTLLYSSYEGQVAQPTDSSVPSEIASLPYANSLDIAGFNGQPIAAGSSQVIVAEQHSQRNTAAIHWITTPVFTGDGHTLFYVEFTSDSQAPFDRHSALFMVQISGSGSNLKVSQPQLVDTSNALLLELGAWYNTHVLTFYADNTIYAFDIQNGAITTIAQTGAYARIIAVIGLGRV